MSTQRHPPHQEHPSTYFVQDRSNREEIQRLHFQDQMLTTGMGGVLPDQPNPASLERLLDVGCGSGGWLIETARTYPSIVTLIGVDISNKMLNYAREQAAAQQVDNRVEFRQMDALRMLEFPNEFFDLVNMRLGGSWLRTWDWRKLLEEYRRVCRPGGVVRVTELDFRIESNSPALSRLFGLLLSAFFQAGHLFVPESCGVISQLVPLLERHGCQQIQTRTSTLEYDANMREWQLFVEDMSHLFRTIVPFLRRWTHVPDQYDEIYQQAMAEIQQPDFMGRGKSVTAWGYW